MIGLFEFFLIGLIILLIVVFTRQSLRRPPAAKPPPTLEKGEARAATSFLRSSLTAQVPRALLVVIRLVQGSMWLSSGWYWVRADTTAEMTQGITDLLAAGRSYGLIVPFVQGTVLPWIGTFAFLVTVGELLVGLSLTFGAATRLGAAAGMYLAFNYACLAGDPLLPVGGHWLTVCYLLPVLIGAAGRSFGVDYWLYRRYPRLPLW